MLSRRVQLPYLERMVYNGSYAMMAKPITALELHYPMIKFLIKQFTPFEQSLPTSSTRSRVYRVGQHQASKRKGGAI